MAVAKYKVRRGTTGDDWYSWDGDLLHDLVAMAAGVGDSISDIVGTTATSLTATAFDNLRTTIRANQVTHAANFCDDVVGNSGATSSIAAFVAAVT